MRADIIAAFVSLMLAPAMAADCLIEVDGTRYIDGPCEFDLIDGSGSFKIGVYPPETEVPRFAYVYVDSAPAYGFWNGEPAESHAHESLGDLTRDGACWFNQEARICAYE